MQDISTNLEQDEPVIPKENIDAIFPPESKSKNKNDKKQQKKPEKHVFRMDEFCELENVSILHKYSTIVPNSCQNLEI